MTTASSPSWYALTEPCDREFRSQECREGQHAPGCCGYYPPGRDTYRCLCGCHQPPQGAGCLIERCDCMWQPEPEASPGDSCST